MYKLTFKVTFGRSCRTAENIPSIATGTHETGQWGKPKKVIRGRHNFVTGTEVSNFEIGAPTDRYFVLGLREN